MKDILALGVSAFIVEISSGIVIIVFNIIILRLVGNLGVAAYGVIANLALVVIAIFTGIGQGIQPIISSNFGRANHDNVRKIFRYGMITALIFAILVYLVTFYYAEPLVNLFNKNKNDLLTQIATNGLKIYFAAFLMIGVNVVAATYLNSIDKPMHAFVISLLRGFIIIIPMAFLLSSLFGINGVWYSVVMTEIIVAVLSIGMLKKVNKSS